MKNNRTERILIYLGILVSVAFAVYFYFEHNGEREWESGFKWFVLGSPLILLPWMILLLLTQRHPHIGAGLMTSLLILVAFSAWSYFEMLIASQDPSRVLAFAIVPGIQFIASLTLWFLAPIRPIPPTR